MTGAAIDAVARRIAVKALKNMVIGTKNYKRLRDLFRRLQGGSKR